MNTIGSLFEKPIDRPIEEVIKVDQDNERAVLTEIGEYVATNSIREQFAEVYRAIAEGPSEPREGNGIWISGFFGSGKSSFAKILGYTVANRKVGSTTASDLFKKNVNDPRLSDLLDSINLRIPFEAIIFDVSMDHGVRTENERLTQILYKALLRELKYSTDFDLAELEFTLEGDGKLEEFEALFEETHGSPWRIRRQLGLAINEASAVLHRMDPKTFSSPDSWAKSTANGRADMDPNKLAKRAHELALRRAKGKALIIVIDEVGQFVSRSVDKMLDLQAIVQAFGVEGRNRTERGESVSPFWIVVTSQEKLSEVVTALDSRKIELARLQDRFRLTVDLKQTDIAEVTARRVLAKRQEALPLLESLFSENVGRIRECCTLERTQRNLEISRQEFVRLYPYLPYQIDLSIDIVAGLRLKRGAHRHVGGSNRTIIKQAQQMMINDRTRLADAPVGTLVTLDRVYELLEAGNLIPTEVSAEVAKVAVRLSHNPMAQKVARAIALLESVKDLPRTPHNIAVVLHPSVTAPSLKKEVETALEELEKAQFVRGTEEGYKLLTVQEKSWETKRGGLEPREADRHAIVREVTKEIFSEPKARIHPFGNLRSFRLRITLDGETVEADGDVPLNLQTAEENERARVAEELRTESAARQSEAFWLVPVSVEARTLVAELYRSREMVAEYERLSAQQKLTAEEGACLSEEKTRRERFSRELRKALGEAIVSGQCFFQGVSRQGTNLGVSLQEVLKGIVDLTVPVLFPKLKTGVLGFSAGESERFLTAANLNGLPNVFYSEKPEDALVVKQGNAYVPNTACTLCREILDYLNREHAYGNKVTGKSIEATFSGLGYGWELESLKVGLAVLFRGGALEIQHQGKKYIQYSDPAVRPVFAQTPAFRSASFSPKVSLDRKSLVAASRKFEEIAGKEVDPEEHAISQAFKELLEKDKNELVPLSTRFLALKIPGAKQVADQLQWVETLLDSDSEEVVKTLASEGQTFRQNRQAVSELGKIATEANIRTLEQARKVLREQWPVLQQRGAGEELEKVAEGLQALLASDDALKGIEKIKCCVQELSTAYRTAYLAAFEKRTKAYETALEIIKGRQEWVQLVENPDIPDDQKDQILQPLTSRTGIEVDLPEGGTVCRKTGATLAQLESETEAAESVGAKVLRKIVEVVSPKERIEMVSVSRLYTRPIATKEELDEFLETLRERFEKILAQGGTIRLE